MSKINHNKKILLIARILFFLIGAGLGALGLWQFIVFYPNAISSSGLTIVFYIGCSFLLGSVLSLSTNIILNITTLLGKSLKSKFKDSNSFDVGGVMLGIIIGLLTGFLCDILLSLFLKILAVRILLDCVVGLSVCYISMLVVNQFINNSKYNDEKKVTIKEDENYLENSSEKVKNISDLGNTELKEVKGYLISSGALSSKSIVLLCTSWLSGEKFILNKTINDLTEKKDDDAIDALATFENLKKNNAIKILQKENLGAENEQLILAAEEYDLKIIVLNREEINLDKESRVEVLVLSDMLKV